ncbi:hypothetical protein AAW12_19515 [Sphingobacterium sp. Ag1]|nr:hypothetical protein AAW12_19515 [Sphingobacterium sp. Ag1]
MGTAFDYAYPNRKIKFKQQLTKDMDTIHQKAKKMGLEKGYYLLLMAILDLPVEGQKKSDKKK